VRRGKVCIVANALHVFPSDIDCRVEIRIADAAMKAYMNCARGYGSGKVLSEEIVRKHLAEKGVRYGIDLDAIEEAVAKANDNHGEQKDILVAQGKKARDGMDGRIEYTFNPARKWNFKVLPNGRVDYRSFRNINTIKKGELLATILDPHEGEPGATVLGERLEPGEGTPIELFAGEGVSTAEDTKKFYADKDGQIVLNGKMIEVLHVYMIEGDVDYSTGNIEFNGNVIVKGSVLEGFKIEARGDIVVLRNVEPAHLEAGCDIIVVGGVQGRGKGVLHAGRNIKVGFAQNAQLEAQGSVSIEKFAVNSTIFTSKYLKMSSNRGAVIGGEVYAQRGIDVKDLGSSNETRTFVEVGTDFLVRRKIKQLEQIMDFCIQNNEKIDQVLKPLVDTMKKNPGALKEKSSIIKQCIQKKKELQVRKRDMNIRRKQLLEQLKEKDVCFIKVKKNCYPYVTIKIKEHRMFIKRRYQNIRFFENRKEGEIGIGPY
jgi:hypothetical protein